MKTKIWITAIATVFSTTLFAQQMAHNENRTTFGLRGGVNFATINGKNGIGARLDNNINTGFHAGLNVEIPIGSGIYLQPGILYSQKGAEFSGDNEVDLSYAEVPVNLIYKPILGTGRMLLGFGPYVGVGIDGKVKGSNGISTDVEFVTKSNATDPGSIYQFKRIDGGANFLAGYEFRNNFSFQINAQLGLAQIAPTSSGTNNELKYKNTVFGASVGYRF